MREYKIFYLSHGGDHALMWVSWGKRESRVKHDPSPSIRHWRTPDIRAFKDHVNKWKPQRHDPVQVGADIQEEVAHYARTHQQVRDTDKEEQELAEDVENHPGDERRQRKLYAYQGKKAEQRLDKALRRFRRTAAQGTSYFYQMLKKSMHAPLSQTAKHPTARSARKILPDFSGNPLWDEERGKELIDRHVRKTLGEGKPPTYKEFMRATSRPLGKGAAADGIPTGAWQLLPYQVLWVLYLGVVWAWTEGTTPTRWVAAKVTLIYKKGLATEAENYRPIFVNLLMYIVFMKVVYWRYASTIMDNLDIYQYAIRRRTTLMQCLNLVHAVTAPKSKWKDGYICKLDIAKAFPSIPHALLYHMMRRMGWSAPLLKAFWESMQRTSCSCTVGADEVRLTPKRGLKKGCPMLPLLFMAYYDVNIHELRRRHPEVLFLSYVDDILFVAASLEEVRAV